MNDLFPTRTRLDLLRAVTSGRVYRSATGHVMRRTDGASMNRRCDSAIREQEAAGWVRLGSDGGTYEPTDAGRALLGGRAACINCTDPDCAGCWGADTHIVDDWRP